MDDAKSLIDAYVPTAFLWAVLVVIGGILLSFGTAFAGGLLWFALADSLAGVWLGAGLLVFAIAFYVFYRLLQELQAQAEHRRQIETKQAQALLNESLPRPAAPEPVPTKSPYPPAMPAIQIASTNQANQDFTLALNMFAATLVALSKEKDGEKLAGKPFSYDAMQKAGYVSRWEDWSRVLDLWENAELVKDPRARSGWKMLVTNVGNAEERLSSLYAHNGLVRINGVWMKS